MGESFSRTVPGALHRMPAAEENPSRELLTKADFLHAVEMVAGDLSKPAPAGSGSDGVEAVFVACSYDTWRRTFGEPRGFREYQGVISAPPVEVWEQPCSDGVVHCVGYFVDDPYEGQRVILTRVCLF
jgi:hypothetical protein